MIGLELTEDGDMGGFFEVPELKTRHFVDDDGSWLELVKNIEGRDADVADKVGVFIFGIKKGFNERTGGAFAFSGSDADDGTGAVVEEIFGDRGFIFEV